MEFIERLEADDLDAILKTGLQDSPLPVPTTSTLYERREDSADRKRALFEDLVDHVRTIEEKRWREIPRPVIRDRIRNALLLGTITMNVSPTNHVASTSFEMRPLSAQERVFGRFMSEETVPTDTRGKR